MGFALAAFGPTRLRVVLGVYPFFRVLRLAVSLLQRLPLANAPKEAKVFGPNVRPSPWLGFLRSGIHPGASPPVCFAAPPLDAFGFAKRSLRSHPRINPSTQPAEGAGTARSKAAAELTLILLSGEKHAVCLGCFAFLWERACSRRRPMGRPISNRPHPIHLWELACQRWRPDSRPISN